MQNRIIKYKYWEEKKQDWVDCIDMTIREINALTVPVSHWTDKVDGLGNEIWDVSIIRHSEGSLGKILFEGGTFLFDFEDSKYKCLLSDHHINEKHIEVVGDTMKNPELVAQLSASDALI